MRIAVCDDDFREQEQFENALQGWDPTQTAEKFSSGTALLEAAKNSSPFDVVFLDIYMPGESGIDIAKRLYDISSDTSVVFVTVSREHAVDAFSLNALHYLIKPVTTEGVIEVFRRLSENRHTRRESIVLTIGAQRYTVFFDQIMLLENDNHAVNVSLADGRRLKVWTPLGELEKKMNGNFLRINRGIVVNMDYIVKMGTDVCVLRNGIRLPVAVRQKAAIRAAYDNYVFERLSSRKGFGVGGGVEND